MGSLTGFKKIAQQPAAGALHHTQKEPDPCKRVRPFLCLGWILCKVIEIGFGNLQQAQCFLVCHKDAVRVQLQDAAGAGRGHRAGHCVLDGLCLGFAVGYH